MKSAVLFFDSFMRKYTPDPYIIAVLITGLVSLLAFFLTDATPNKIITSWGDGFWNLIAFTLQMSMILLGGYLVASSPLVNHGLQKICSKVKSPAMAIVVTTLLSALAAWLNWGFGLVVGAFLAVEMTKAVPKANFRALVASSYSGFLLWHAGLSGSIPLVVNTENNFSFEFIGRTIPLSETLFSQFNIIAVLGLLILLPLTNLLLARSLNETNLITYKEEMKEPSTEPATTPAEHLERSPIIPIIFSVFAFYYLALKYFEGHFRLDLNSMNFIFLFLGILLHFRTKSFLASVEGASSKIGPILVQYPLYAGIMGIMRETGLAHLISDFFVNTSTQLTFPLFTFLGAGVVNFFVPSGGGQWAIQAPIVIPAAEALGVDVPLAIMAVTWGDAWTNMAQPFWALPLLAIAGLGAKDILGFTLTVLIVSGLYLGALFLIFA